MPLTVRKIIVKVEYNDPHKYPLEIAWFTFLVDKHGRSLMGVKLLTPNGRRLLVRKVKGNSRNFEANVCGSFLF